jgi:hypothetical protein
MVAENRLSVKTAFAPAGAGGDGQQVAGPTGAR